MKGVKNKIYGALVSLLLRWLYVITTSAEPFGDDRIIFESYGKIFSFIAKHELLEVDSARLLILAGDSKIDRSSIGGIGDVMIIESNFYGDHRYNQIRGIQLNGRYFVIKKTQSKFELIGVLHGNRYQWNNVGKTIRIIASWHMSASDSPETTYTWDGNRFEPFAIGIN